MIASSDVMDIKSSFVDAFHDLKGNYRNVILDRLSGNTLAQTSRKLRVTPPRVWQIERKGWHDIVTRMTLDELEHRGVSLGYFLTHTPRITTRAYNALIKNNVLTLMDLLELNEQRLLCLRGVGSKTLSEIYGLVENLRRGEFE